MPTVTYPAPFTYNTVGADTSSCITNYDVIWINWCQGISTAVTTDSYTAIWAAWNNSATNVVVVPSVWNFEEVRRREEETRLRCEAMEAQRRVAAYAAKDLLLQHLDPQQREEFNRFQRFTVHILGKEPKEYRVEYGTAGNIKLMKDGRAVRKYCIHPGHEFGLPTEDVMLAQKLMIEADEAQFLKIANATLLVAA